ncbi:MAG: hypothetical protein ACNS60_05180 [Candidatus Cyclobacteriaceae bacterium M2_1C_046]
MKNCKITGTYILFFLVMTLGISSCCDEAVPPDQLPIRFIYYDSINDQNLISSDNQEDQISVFTESGKPVNFQLFNVFSAGGFIISATPWQALGYQLEQELDQKFYIRFEQKTDTIRMLSFFQENRCDYTLAYINMFINGDLVQPEPDQFSETYIIYR